MHNAHTFAAYVYAALGASYYRSLSPESLLVRFRTKQITFTGLPPVVPVAIRIPTEACGAG